MFRRSVGIAPDTIAGFHNKHEGNKIWNRLSVDIKTLESLAIFKIKINKWQPRF